MALSLNCCRGDRIRTCDPLVPNQVRYQLRHAPKTDIIQASKHYDLLSQRAFSLKRCANLVLFFKNNNKLAHECTQFVVIYAKSMIFLNVFSYHLNVHDHSYSHSRNHIRSHIHSHIHSRSRILNIYHRLYALRSYGHFH